MWTTETADEYTDVMAEIDVAARETDSGPGVLMIIDAGEMDMDLLVSLFD